MEPRKPSKRLDLQGIRGMAIIVVVIFHFFPEIFPNGYLGVDQFFVLSGFLMCMLLKREEEKSAWDVMSVFYVKRFKRLVPLYFLFVFLATLALCLFFPDTCIETNRDSASRALLFVSNREETSGEEHYHVLRVSKDIFLHTWSLSAEFQFYFLIPIVFLFASQLSLSINWQCFYYGVLGSLSFLLYSLYYCSVGSFSVFGRFWQFLIGFLVFLSDSKSPADYMPLCKVPDNSSPKCSRLTQGFKYTAIISLITVTCYPRFRLPVEYTRPFVTLCTALLMLVSHEDIVLSNRVLTYIGDISYSLYLVHWPFFVYWAMTAGGSQTELYTALFASVVLAAIAFETFEKWYLRQSNTIIGAIVGVLFLLNVALINKNVIQDHFQQTEMNRTRLDGVTDSMTIEDAETLNHRWTTNNIHNLQSPSCKYEDSRAPFGWCRRRRGLEGQHKVMIIGNSWATNHGTLLHQECGPKMKSFLQGSGCEQEHSTWYKPACILADFGERIREEKPDIVFLLSRYISIGEAVPGHERASKVDTKYDKLRDHTMEMLGNIGKKLYILHAIPRIKTKNLHFITEMLKNGTDPMDIDKTILDWTGYRIARERLNRLKSECGEKCELVDYTETFSSGTTPSKFRYFDERGFSFFTASNDLSPRGLEHIRPVWTKICSRL